VDYADGALWRPDYLAVEGGEDYDEDNTALISTINGALFGLEQLLIPPALIPTLGISSLCTSAQNKDLVFAVGARFGRVDWRTQFVGVGGQQYWPAAPPAAPFPPDLRYSKLIPSGDYPHQYDSIPGSIPG
jgi:hypothetical protein